MLADRIHLSSKAHNHWSFYLDCPSLSLNLMLNAWDLMLWERPITLRMMFLPQNLAKNDAKNKQTQKDWGLKRRVQSEFGISTLDYIQEIRAKSPSRRISKIKNSNRKVPDAVNFLHRSDRLDQVSCCPMESIMKSPNCSDSKKKSKQTRTIP